jgi:hypothetical protein
MKGIVGVMWGSWGGHVGVMWVHWGAMWMHVSEHNMHMHCAALDEEAVTTNTLKS